jgi:fumarylpyruvate hydrolase
MEMVVVIGKPGFRVRAEDAHEVIYGYATGLDMTRRDLQLVARYNGSPWDLAKTSSSRRSAPKWCPWPVSSSTREKSPSK